MTHPDVLRIVRALQPGDSVVLYAPSGRRVVVLRTADEGWRVDFDYTRSASEAATLVTACATVAGC